MPIAEAMLAVYRGPTRELVVANDDAEDGKQSLVAFDAEEGVEYAIAVDGYHGASGDAVLNWRLEA